MVKKQKVAVELSVIFEEIKRQSEVQAKIDEAHDVKLAAILGFIAVIFSAFFFTDVQIGPYSLASFGFLMLSSISAGTALFRQYPIGPDMPEVIRLYKAGEYKDLQQAMSGYLKKSNEENLKIMKRRVLRLKISIIFLLFSMILFFIARLKF